MKSEVKYILVSLGVTLVGAAVTATGVYSSNKRQEEFLKTPTISDQASLEAALAGEKQIYCLTNMPVSGTAAEDPLGILEDDYLYIYYEKSACTEEVKNGEAVYTWEYSTDDVMDPTYASEMLLFDQYPVTMNTYTAVADASELTADQVKEEYQELVDVYYYPEQVGDSAGNVRYTLTALPMNQEVAMYATVGDGEIVMEYNDDMASYIIIDGTAEDLATYFGGDAGMMRTLIGIMMIIPLGLLMLVSTIIFAITTAVAQRKKVKKKAQNNK